MTREGDALVVVGAGIVGLATAYHLARSSALPVIVAEAEGRVARHQTGHNSGVIHSGLYYRPGSLKAQLCRKGREELLAFCQSHGIPFELCGKLVVATREEQIPALEELARRGEANGLEALRWVEGAEIPRYEPAARGVAALWVGDTGIVDFRQVAEVLAREVQQAGGELRLGFRVRQLASTGRGWRLNGPGGAMEARGVVVCAGLHADRLARQVGVGGGIRIVPFRGEYWELAAHRRHLVRNLIYPVPDPRFPFLGVHFTRRLDGRVEAGPNAVLAFAREGYRFSQVSLRDLAETLTFPGFWRLARRYWRTGLAEMRRSLSKACFCRALQELVPEIREEDLEGRGSGVRAQALDRQGQLLDDFAFGEAPRGLFVLNAPSPAATAALAIGRVIGDKALELVA
ncbi:hydroxyglutarate oxidase [Thermoanaerobaculum aquaticum]|uniref:Hydroxyglutarate oxidase n=1 Tax=Thermoanaerobaculum aquaticum TaxID=1312852 RepID=A0A062XVA6_9BACT|nr:L-2-hydroxyglutarate oxidase [Thermoanaerobaculum aquaticum]KDA54803.1 hydroxyglutarate oxidase [Thermoanaerobaculum aquaticum]